MGQNLILYTFHIIYFDELFIHILVFVGESKVDVINIVEREYIFTNIQLNRPSLQHCISHMVIQCETW